MVKPPITQVDGGVAFTVKVVPGSSRTCISGLLDGMVKVKVAAPPEKGKANQCLIAFLARRLGVRKKDIKIISGDARPVKHLHVAGITSQASIKALALEDSV